MCMAEKTYETYLYQYLFVINKYKIVSSCGNLVYYSTIAQIFSEHTNTFDTYANITNITSGSE